MPATYGHIQNRSAAGQVVFAPGLSADDEWLAIGISPFHHDATTIFRTIQTGGAIGHPQPVARHVVKRKILAKDVGVDRVTIGDGMLRPVKSDPHVSSGSSSGGML